MLVLVLVLVVMVVMVMVLQVILVRDDAARRDLPPALATSSIVLSVFEAMVGGAGGAHGWWGVLVFWGSCWEGGRM